MRQYAAPELPGMHRGVTKRISQGCELSAVQGLLDGHDLAWAEGAHLVLADAAVALARWRICRRGPRRMASPMLEIRKKAFVQAR